MTNKTKPEDTYISQEKSHGRKIIRQVEVYKNSGICYKNWSHIQSLIKVERWGWRGQKAYQETAYHLSSISVDAQTFSAHI